VERPVTGRQIPPVVRLPGERLDEVVETLSLSFFEYPVMRYILKDAGSDYDGQLRDLVAYFTDSRFSRGWPVLGIEVEGALVAAANVTPPRRTPRPPSLVERYERLRERTGVEAITRFEAFAEATESLEPDAPHYMLGMIGVPPAHQGKGYARPLLEAVHEMSADDPESTGVLLSTETSGNLPLYQHFGYRILGEARVDELITWALYRPD
jgi:GNAT superfamily N-acetyltransferase